MTTATITSKGQITLPAEVRSRLQLVAGSKFSVRETSEGEIVLWPKKGDIRALRGILKYEGPPVSIEDMNEAVGRGAVLDYLESLK